MNFIMLKLAKPEAFVFGGEADLVAVNAAEISYVLGTSTDPTAGDNGAIVVTKAGDRLEVVNSVRAVLDALTPCA